MQYNWNWNVFWLQSPEGTGTYLGMLLQGLLTTLSTAALAGTLALLLGSAVGILRSLPGPTGRVLSSCWIELFRNIPLLVQLFLLYFVLPEVVPAAWGAWLKQSPNAAFHTAVVGIGLYMSARVAVQVSAGIAALPAGQKAAGIALGLTLPQTYRYVLLPVAFRIILPTLTSDMLSTIKSTSVALTIGLAELTARAQAMQEFSFQVFEAYTAATVAYLLVNLVATLSARWLERRTRIPGFSRT
ncbi:amino acid ABC transporter permease [Bosea sp. 685]|uniref:amino acid ABC transporter permease n=1 Tax=Bosea sp. 685 TaxID=3080057 RepID=UPI002892EE53|nr:amino acid ABC transporter permease [Bosea sp. 685]WNJ88043.1 amino acid ABC transporter permease [Bosea sp. 685]